LSNAFSVNSDYCPTVYTASEKPAAVK